MIKILLLQEYSGRLQIIEELCEGLGDCHVLAISEFENLPLSIDSYEPDLLISSVGSFKHVQNVDLDDSITLLIARRNVEIDESLFYIKDIANFLILDHPELVAMSLAREIELLKSKHYIQERKQVELFFQAIMDITSSLLEIQSLDEIARLVIDRIIKHFKFEDCVIYELNKEDNTLTQVAARGPKEDEAHYVKDPLTLKVGHGIVGNAAKYGEPILVSDVTLDSRYVVDDAERKSELSVPIKLNGEVIGVIDSEHHEKNFYTEKHLQNLEAVANVIAIKFHAAQLRREKEDAQKELQHSLDEKVVLLSEVHHRVKNNLAIISGLLHLQSKDIKQPELVQILLEMSNRIQSIAGVHELLYNSESFAEITFDKYVNSLLGKISSTLDRHTDTILELDIDEDLKININQAIPLGLILNELVTNSYKYAFHAQSNPKISFKLHLMGEEIEGEYSDNGPGFSPQEIISPKSLGFTLISTLFEQLEAKLNYDMDKVYPLKFRFNFTLGDENLRL